MTRKFEDVVVVHKDDPNITARIKKLMAFEQDVFSLAEERGMATHEVFVAILGMSVKMACFEVSSKEEFLKALGNMFDAAKRTYLETAGETAH